MDMQPVFQPEVYLEGFTHSTDDDEFFQSLGLYLDCADHESVSIEPFIWEKTVNVEIFLETAMSLTGPWRRFDTTPLADKVSFVLTKSDLATNPLWRYVRWVIRAEHESTPAIWTVNFSATYRVN